MNGNKPAGEFRDLKATVPASDSAIPESEAPPELVRVTVWAAVAVPTVVEAKVSDVGLSEAFAAAGASAPVPVSGTDWGEPTALSAMLTVAVRVPVAVGLKVTVMVQEALTAMLEPQVLFWL